MNDTEDRLSMLLESYAGAGNIQARLAAMEETLKKIDGKLEVRPETTSDESVIYDQNGNRYRFVAPANVIMQSMVSSPYSFFRILEDYVKHANCAQFLGDLDNHLRQLHPMRPPSSQPPMRPSKNKMWSGVQP